MQNETIPHELRTILKEFGPRNPLLEEIDIRTFSKVKRKHARQFCDVAAIPDPATGASEDQLIFVEGNGPFLGELKKLYKAGHNDFDIQSEQDLMGKTDSQLFPAYASAYLTSDDAVMNSGDPDERIEKHPSSTGDVSVDVQVLKLPLRMGGEEEAPVGVQGYYWPAAEGDVVRDKLKQLHDAWAILNDAPVAVFRKDTAHRFMYANKEFLRHVREGGKDFSSIEQIIGKKYADVFDPAWAKRYEDDDDAVLSGTEPRRVTEGLVANRVVQIIKTPILRENGTGGSKIVGIQGVFFELNDWGVPRKKVAIDLAKRQIHIIGESTPLKYNFGGEEWILFDIFSQRLDEEVTYEEIADHLAIYGRKIYSSERIDPGGSSSKQERTKLKGRVHDIKRHLVASLTAVGLASRFKIDDIQNVGYTMALLPKLEPPVPTS